MEKYSITVYTKLDAFLINNKILKRSQWDKEPVFEGYPLHAGINYTTDPLVYECAKKLESEWESVSVELSGKDFDLRKEFSKFRFCNGINVHLSDQSDVSLIYTLYLRNKELVSIGFSPEWDNDRKYTVFVNNPYYENGEYGFVERKEVSRKQYIFLKTRSAKIAFNMVNRIVANMRYPKAKNIW